MDCRHTKIAKEVKKDVILTKYAFKCDVFGLQLVEVNSTPRIKLSEDVEKVTMPGKKVAYRLYGNDGNALVDLLQQPEENEPKIGERVLCRHPFQVTIAMTSSTTLFCLKIKDSFECLFYHIL